MVHSTKAREQHFHALICRLCQRKKLVFTQNALNNVVPVRALHGGHGAVKSALAVCHRLGEGVLRVLGGGKDLWEFIQVLQCYSRHSSSGRSSRWSGRGRAGSRRRKSTLRALEKGKKKFISVVVDISLETCLLPKSKRKERRKWAPSLSGPMLPTEAGTFDSERSFKVAETADIANGVNHPHKSRRGK